MSNPTPSVSVLIITFDSADHLRDCVNSVLAQTLRPEEIIICDDHSSDHTFDIAEEYAHRFPDLFRLHRQEQNMGPARNGNVGRKMARGEFFSKIDGDDRWLPRKLEMEWKALRANTTARIAYSGVIIVDARGKRIGRWRDDRREGPLAGDVFIEVYARKFFSNSRSVFRDHLIHRSLFDECGYYDDGLESYWDWDEKIRFTKRSPVVFSGEALVEYRTHERAFSRKDPGKHFRAMAAIYEKHLPSLEDRSNAESARVRCSIESLLAQQQEGIPEVERTPRYSAAEVSRRNAELLAGLSQTERKRLESDQAPDLVRLHAQLVREWIRVGRPASRPSTLRTLLRYFLLTDVRFKVSTLLRSPGWFFRHAGLLFRSFRERLDG